MPNTERSVNIPEQMVRVEVSNINVDNRTVDVVFTTGQRGLQEPWWDEPYYEELEISDEAIRTSRLDKGLSLLDSHQRYRGIRGVHGITESYTIENGEIRGKVRIASDPESESVWIKLKDKVLRHFSIGYKIHKLRWMGQENAIDIYRAIDWEPTELSIVPVSFETNNGLRSEERKLNKCIIINKEGKPMADEVEDNNANEDSQTRSVEPATPATPATINENEVRQGLNGFITSARAANFNIEHATEAFTRGISISQYNQEILSTLAERSSQAAPNAPIISDDRNDLNEFKREDFADAIHARVTGDYSKLSDNARSLAHMSIVEASRHYMTQGNKREYMGMSPLKFAGRALHTTSDLPLILENVMNKELLAAYMETERTFLNIARRSTATDFREKHTYKMGDAPDLLPLGENGEYKYGTFSESKESYRVATYARKLAFTRQMFINDDLDALSRYPRAFGQAGSRLESDIVWGLILNYDFIKGVAANHVLSDGKALFHADHKNLLTAGSALSLTTLGKVRELGRQQKTLDGKRMNVSFQTLALPTTLETKGMQLMNGLYVPTNVDDSNTFKGQYDIVIEPRIDDVTTTGQYYFSTRYQAIEYAYLQGNESLYTEVIESTDIDGTAVLARHDFGAGFEDYRGAAKATGAA